MMENHQGIVEYGPEKLRVQTAQGIVSVEGENLTLASLGEEDSDGDGRDSPRGNVR